jgi:hypothetical protein
VLHGCATAARRVSIALSEQLLGACEFDPIALSEQLLDACEFDLIALSEQLLGACQFEEDAHAVFGQAVAQSAS